MKEIVCKLLGEVDPDIKEIMLKIEPRNQKDGYENWALIPDPINAILRWQELRDRKIKIN